MNKTFKISGFPTEHEEIRTPNIAELLTAPFFQYASIEDVYKYGTPFQRGLLAKAPILRNTEHIMVDSAVQLLSPGERSIMNRNGFKDEWHVDQFIGDADENANIHIFITDCSARTEFNVTPIDLDLPADIGWLDFNKHLTVHSDELGLKPEKIKPNRFYTFNRTHAHRATDPMEREFRFWFRVIETNVDKPIPMPRCRLSQATVTGSDGRSIVSIEHHRNAIVIKNAGVYIAENQSK